MYRDKVNFEEPKNEDIIDYLRVIYEDLDNLHSRLVLDYNGDTVFSQYEEDRLVLGNLLDLLDNLKGFI